MKCPELPGKGHVFSALPLTLHPVLGESEAIEERGPQGGGFTAGSEWLPRCSFPSAFPKVSLLGSPTAPTELEPHGGGGWLC